MTEESDEATLPTENSADTQDPVDWQKRYTDTQAAFTQNQQTLADERKVLEDEQAALERVQEKFPHWFADEQEEETPEFEADTPDEISPLRSKVEQVEQWQQQIEAERAQARFETDLNTELGDDQVPGKVHDWIYDRTLSLQGQLNNDGPKALKQAVEEYRAIATELGSKKKARVPHVPSTGQAGTGVKDFSQMSRDEIDAYMVERARALEAQ